MSGLDLVPYLLLALEGGLVVVAAVFFLSGVDDFFVDVVHIVRSLYRRWFVMPKHRALTEAHLLAADEEPLAILVPAWNEGTVIRSSLENTLQTVRYSDFHVFVGTYPNDPETRAAVDAVAAVDDHVHRVETSGPGPTSKADCLNAIYGAARAFEAEHGVRFAAFVLHDAEDIVHPLSFKLFNYLAARKDMVQLPVFPLEGAWHELTTGHYLDEFAENHSKDLVVRERLCGQVPCAGVGCAFSRRAMAAMAEAGDGAPFRLGSLTEDYDFAFRLRELGMSEVFVHHGVERSRVRRRFGFGRPRAVAHREVIATREMFPRRFGAAVRQKARWILGIGFQGWERLGWRGDGWIKYMLARDRKALLTNWINMLGYVVLLGLVALWAVPRIFPDAYRYPPLVKQGSWLWRLIVADTFFLGVRAVSRMVYVQRIYGWRQSLLSLPRQVWANVVNFAAVFRATRLWLGHKLGGRPLAWEKTAHRVPDARALRAYRARLGDLLVAREHITRAQLNEALERQTRSGEPIGGVLVGMGLVDETTVVRALGQQLRLETRPLEPQETPLELLRLLPRALAVRYSVYPVGLTDDGRLSLAMDRVLEREEVEEVRRAVEHPLDLCLATHSDVAFAIRHGYARLAADPEHGDGAESPAEPLGERLVARGLLTREQLDTALAEQRAAYRRLGDTLLAEGMLDAAGLERAVAAYVASTSRSGGLPQRFGGFLVQHGLLEPRDLERALAVQRRANRRFGEMLVDRGWLSEPELASVLEESAA